MNIKISSDGANSDQIEKLLEQIKKDFRNLNFDIGNYPETDSFELNISILSKTESELFNKLLSLPNLKKKSVFVLCENTDFVPKLARDNFQKIYSFPEELDLFKDELIKELSNLSQKESERESKEYELSLELLIGRSEEANKNIDKIKKIAENPNINLLLLGESGTGKGRTAKLIHKLSNNNDTPYIEINCSSLPPNLIESELYGYEKGAFTDAKDQKLGLFELAENGSIFLDEIADLDITTQAKMLRVIEKKVVRRLGGIYDIPINARIISATDKNLLQLVENELFRKDLYYRLNVVSIHLLPLRERREDIIYITEFLMRIFNRQFSKNVDTIDNKLYQFIHEYEWKGNLRELEHSVERSILLAEDNVLRLEHFTETSLFNRDNTKIKEHTLPYFEKPLGEPLPLEEIERIYAIRILQEMKGNKFKTAKALKISRPKLDRLLKSI